MQREARNPIKEQMNTYEPHAGQAIEDACRALTALASTGRAHMEFNGTQVFADPGEPLSTVRERWWQSRRQMEQARDAAERDALEAPRRKLLATLRSLKDSKDPEQAHCDADAALLEYINDLEVAQAFVEVKRWYS